MSDERKSHTFIAEKLIFTKLSEKFSIFHFALICWNLYATQEINGMGAMGRILIFNVWRWKRQMDNLYKFCCNRIVFLVQEICNAYSMKFERLLNSNLPLFIQNVPCMIIPCLSVSESWMLYNMEKSYLNCLVISISSPLLIIPWLL